MEYNTRSTSFRTPTRQAKFGIIANFLFFAQKLLRAFLPVIFIFIVKDTSHISISWIVIGSVILLLLAVVWAYLYYRNFFFYIDEEAESFVIIKGVLSKSKTIIPLDKIQQVTLNQKLIHKIVQVYAVEIDSAGSTEKEVVIPSVSYRIAVELKRILLSYTSKALETNSDNSLNSSEENETVQKLSILTLIKIGLTTSYLQTFGLILGFFVMLYDQYFKLFFEGYTEEEVVEMYRTSTIESIMILYAVIVLVGIVLIVNVVRVLVRFFDFNISIQNGTFLVSYGLLSTRNILLRPKRIQLLRIVQNYFQKRMDLFHIKISQIVSDESKGKKTGLEIPGYSKAEKEYFFKEVYRQTLMKPLKILSPNFRFWLFRFFILGIIPLGIGALAYITKYNWKNLALYGVVFLILVGLIQYRTFKNRKLIVYDHLICIRTGFWDITDTWLESSKIQKVVVSQYFWQKRHDIGSLCLYTAGGKVRFQTTSYVDLVELVDLWLYEVESLNKDWM